MADTRFFENTGPHSLSTLLDVVKNMGLDIEVDQAPLSVEIGDLAPLDSATASSLSFLENPKYKSSLTASSAKACLVSKENAHHTGSDTIPIVTSNPYFAYALIADFFYTKSSSDTPPAIAGSASIGKNVSIANGVEIGENTLIEAGCVIGVGVKIGANCTIHSNVNLQCCVIGDSVKIHPGASIGQDGFGFATHQGIHTTVPQLGRVVLHDTVDIGANTTIDRGAHPDTIIGQGTRIDNLVQIGHNVEVGRGCIIVSHVGISGSTKIGDYTVIAGQTGVAGHLTIGSMVKIAARSGITRDIEDGQTVGGYPAVPIQQFHRQTATLAKLTKRK